MVVQHNMTALNANRNLGVTHSRLAKSTEKLSSGYRVNRAGDDAAGLSISEKMRGQVRGLQQASANAQNGISLLQTAEGAMNEVHSILQRMRELCVQAANDTNVAEDRTAISDELTQLTSEVQRIASETEFNTQKLNGGTFHLQVGANKGQQISVNLTGYGKSDLGIGSVASNVSAYSKATKQISVLDSAITKLSKARSKIGAYQNRLEYTIANANNAAENTQSAESLIRDTDMASEMVKYSKDNILQQAAQSMLAQANQANQGVLSLLG